MDLGKDNVARLLARFSIPAILAMFTSAFYNMVDRLFISYGVGADAFSAMTVTGPLNTILTAFNMLVGIGAAFYISIKLGEGRKDCAEKTLGNAFTLLVVNAVLVLTLCILFLNPILYRFGASPVTIHYARSYMLVMLGGFPVTTLSFGLYHMTRSSGSPTKAMLSMILGAVLNIGLDALFIFTFHWGVAGAAYATLLSQFIAMLWILSFFRSQNSPIRLYLCNLRLEWAIAQKILSIGLSPFVRQLALSVVAAMINNLLLLYGGDDAVGAFGAVNMLQILFQMPVMGLVQGSQPIIGYNYGAKQVARVKKALFYSVLCGGFIGLLGTIISLFWAAPIINFFTHGHAGINAYAIPALRIVMSLFALGAMQIISAIFFQAIGKSKTTLALNLLAQVFLRIPLCYFLPTFMGINGVWAAAPLADLIAFVITMLVLWQGIRKLEPVASST